MDYIIFQCNENSCWQHSCRDFTSQKEADDFCESIGDEKNEFAAMAAYLIDETFLPSYAFKG